tara:strand:+ start:278 stop:562 length:285 start_codon:yes stop_codon:yes gene_type:complete
MIAMHNKFEYENDAGEVCITERVKITFRIKSFTRIFLRVLNLFPQLKELQSSMVVFGEDEDNTAMAKTVGLPAAIVTKLILNGSIKDSGMKIES